MRLHAGGSTGPAAPHGKGKHSVGRELKVRDLPTGNLVFPACRGALPSLTVVSCSQLLGRILISCSCMATSSCLHNLLFLVETGCVTEDQSRSQPKEPWRSTFSKPPPIIGDLGFPTSTCE